MEASFTSESFVFCFNFLISNAHVQRRNRFLPLCEEVVDLDHHKCGSSWKPGELWFHTISLAKATSAAHVALWMMELSWNIMCHSNSIRKDCKLSGSIHYTSRVHDTIAKLCSLCHSRQHGAHVLMYTVLKIVLERAYTAVCCKHGYMRTIQSYTPTKWHNHLISSAP